MADRGASSDTVHVIVATATGDAQSRAALPVYEQLHQHAPILLSNGTMAVVSWLDADQHAAELRTYHIHAFPAIVILYDARRLEYTGTLSYDAIVDFLNRITE